MNIMHVNWNDAAEIVTFLFPFEAQISLCSFGSWMGHPQKGKKKDCSALVKRMMVVLLDINILFFSF